MTWRLKAGTCPGDAFLNAPTLPIPNICCNFRRPGCILHYIYICTRMYGYKRMEYSHKKKSSIITWYVTSVPTRGWSWGYSRRPCCLVTDYMNLHCTIIYLPSEVSTYKESPSSASDDRQVLSEQTGTLYVPCMYLYPCICIMYLCIYVSPKLSSTRNSEGESPFEEQQLGAM